MKPPWLKITYDNGFDDRVTVKTTLTGNGLGEIVAAMQSALAGMGFSEELIKEYFEKEGGEDESN